MSLEFEALVLVMRCNEDIHIHYIKPIAVVFVTCVQASTVQENATAAASQQ